MIATKGYLFRWLCSWIARAISSFPVPVSPVIRTGEGLFAIRRIIRWTSMIAGLVPIMPSKYRFSLDNSLRSSEIRIKNPVICPLTRIARVEIFVAMFAIVTLFSNRSFPSMIRFTTADGKICHREEEVISQILSRFAASWLYWRITPWASVRRTGCSQSSIMGIRLESRFAGPRPPEIERIWPPNRFAISVIAFR